MYVDLPAGFRDIGRLQKIQDKDGAAQLMTAIFGDFDQEFEEMGIKYGALSAQVLVIGMLCFL